MKIWLTLILLLLPIALFGDVATNNNANTILEEFTDAAAKWVGAIKPAAQYLFWSFVTIDMVITFGFLALKGTEFGEIWGELVRKILWIGFFLFLFQTAGLLSNIPDSFSELATKGGGIDVQPDTILEQAFTLVGEVWEGAGVFDVEGWASIIAGVICLAAFALMAAQLFMVLIKLQILIVGSYMMFAFGGLSYTRDMAVNPLKAVFAAGMELLFIKLFIGLTLSTFHNWNTSVNNDVGSSMTIIVMSILLASAVSNINGVVSSLMSGGMGGTSTSGLAVAAGAVAGTAMGAATAAKHGVGIGSAVSAAKELSAAAGGGTMKNLAKAMGSDVLNTIKGKSHIEGGTTGSRAADSMKAQTSNLNESKVMSNAQNDASGGAAKSASSGSSYANSIKPGSRAK